MFMGPRWGPSGADKTQVGPMNFAILAALGQIKVWRGIDYKPYNQNQWWSSFLTQICLTGFNELSQTVSNTQFTM